MKPMSKLKHQIKSNKYYLFWGACTLAVMTGQIYVGTGYRKMSQSVDDLAGVITIKIELDELRHEYNTIRGDGFLY